MMSRAAALESAYILHSRDYRDTSVILDILTRNQGRYSVVVRGARSPKSKTRGRLQLFTPLLIAAVGRGELKTATTIDYPTPPFRIAGEKLYLGLYVNELLYRLLGRFDPVEEVFDAYEELLESLQQEDSAVLAVREFELNLLMALGYGISFEYDARDGQAVEPDGTYRFAVHEGFHRVSGDDAEMFAGKELLALADGNLAMVDPRRLLALTRASLAVLLGDKPLKSRALFRSIAR